MAAHGTGSEVGDRLADEAPLVAQERMAVQSRRAAERLVRS